jgi:predicted DNA-binding protein (MmcQ/YjbR family)
LPQPSKVAAFLLLMDNDFVRSFCLGLPNCTEDVKWDNDLVFSVAGKMFCITALDLPFKCSFKVKDEEFEELACRQGFIPAPYMVRAKWVQVTNPSELHKEEWEFYIRQSYELVKAKLTKKIRSELGLE